MRSRLLGGIAWALIAALPCAAQSSAAPVTTALTRHPIVLVHGAFGFDDMGPIDYFNDVSRALRGLGAEVLVTQTSALHRTAHRAEQLKQQLLRAYPDPAVKLNLIAHSQGGLDARFMIAHLGMRDRVASVTTLGTPHRGTVVADLALHNTPGALQRLGSRLLAALGWDAGVFEDVSVRHMALFNLLTPDDPRILYQSWGGRATLFGRGVAGRLTFLFVPTHYAIRPYQGGNDGLVPLSSSRWGVWRGEVGSDHGGLIGWGFSGFDHVSFYEDIVLELALLGF